MAELSAAFAVAAERFRAFALAWQQPPWRPLDVDEFARRDPIAYLAWRRAVRAKRAGSDE